MYILICVVNPLTSCQAVKEGREQRLGHVDRPQKAMWQSPVHFWNQNGRTVCVYVCANKSVL